MFNNNERDKMINEKSLESKILKMDCYDQELWVADNQDIISNSSNEFKSFIKDLDFETGQTALENSNADYYAQTMKGIE
jgi:hypothetical protein